MKTKALLLAGLVSLAGVTASEAQTVYSINSVGYYNLSIPTGYSMIANQMFSSETTLQDLLPNPTPGMIVFKWTGALFESSEYFGAPFNAWSPDGSATLVPGEGAFIFNPGSAYALTFSGEVPTGNLQNPLVAGFSVRSSIVPQNGLLSTTLGMPVSGGDIVYKWTGNLYQAYEYFGAPFNAWNPEEPTVNIGESFFLYKTASTTWTRDFSISSDQ